MLGLRMLIEWGAGRGPREGSAIHGDPTRGYGILNNERYLGRLNWGRLQWKCGAANSRKRTAIVADTALLVTREHPRLRIISDKLWQRVKARQSARAIGPIGVKVSKAGKPATTLLSGLLLCADCGSRFIARDQRSYQCATRAYGGLSACSNEIRVHRENAEAAIVNYLAEELLSPEAINVAKRDYREAVIQELESREPNKSAKPDVIRVEEAKIREMLKAGILSPDVAQAALDAIAIKRRRATSLVRISPATAVESFGLAAER